MEQLEQKCPQCDASMRTKRSSSVTQSGKTYDWAEFVCERDDVWIERWVPHQEEEASS